MGGEAIDVGYQESFEALDMELLELQNITVDELTTAQVLRVMEIANDIIKAESGIVFRQRLETALLAAKIGEHHAGSMNDSEKLCLVQMLNDLNYADDGEFDSFELPMVLEVAEAQELLALSIEAEIVDGVDVVFEVLEDLQDLVVRLSEKANDQFDSARGDVAYTGMGNDEDDFNTGDIRDGIVTDIEDELEGKF